MDADAENSPEGKRMIQLQYDLFTELPDEMSELRQVVAEMKSSQDRQRKALFAKVSAGSKELIEMMEEVHRLKFEVEALKKMIHS